MTRVINADKMIEDTEAIRQVSDAITIDGIVKYINENAITDVQEVKHGKWCEGRFGNGITVPFSKYYICDQCNHTSQKKSRYCEYCGTKMDGKK